MALAIIACGDNRSVIAQADRVMSTDRDLADARPTVEVALTVAIIAKTEDGAIGARDCYMPDAG